VLIVSTVLVAALGTFGGLARARLIQTDRTLAYGLADNMLAEVMQGYFKEPGGGTTLGPDAGEIRGTYDDVDVVITNNNGPARLLLNDANPYAAWLERMQRTRGRHAAITKNLYTWSSYKHWADKVKGSWEDEPVPTKK